MICLISRPGCTGRRCLVARSKLDVILGALAPRLAGQALGYNGDMASRLDADLTPDGIAIIPVVGTLVARSGYLAAPAA